MGTIAFSLEYNMLSFQAYKNWLQKNGQESWRLPGINFTSEQLFYIGFGQVIMHRSSDSQKTPVLSEYKI